MTEEDKIKAAILTFRPPPQFWRAIMQLQAEAVHQGRACDLRERPYLQEAYEKGPRL